MRFINLAFLLWLVIVPNLQAQTPYLVKDINTSESYSPASSRPYDFFGYGGRVFFLATTNGTQQLWATDGTEAGTSKVSSVRPTRFTIVGQRLLFNASDIHGEELWATDGTEAGTRLLADINSNGSSRPGDRIVYRGKMIFAADDGVDGRELWITDGTPAGTRFFKDLVPGPEGSDPRSFVLLNDVIYFSADGSLWKSNGTEAGTVKVTSTIYPSELTVAGYRIFFSGSDDETGLALWTSDGTEAGTYVIARVPPGSSDGGYRLTPLGNRVLFLAWTSTSGDELWISDGSLGETHVVRDINPGPADGVYNASIAVFHDIAYFSATSPTTGNELWKTDGTESGTVLVKDIADGLASSTPFGLLAGRDGVFFAAGSTAHTMTLWLTDGTENGTHPVKTIDPIPMLEQQSLFRTDSSPVLVNIDGTIYFAGANRLNGYEPWKSDGTDSGTVMIANLTPDIAPSSLPSPIGVAGNLVYFSAWNGLDRDPLTDYQIRRLWRSDGTPDGTYDLSDAFDSVQSPITRFVPVGRFAFFEVDQELWMTDGTRQGTRAATEFVNRFPSRPSIALVIGDRIFANVQRSLADTDLWTTTVAPDAPAVLLGPGAAAVVELAGKALYLAHDGLWTSDGTAAGTHRVGKDLSGLSMTVAGGLVYFVRSGHPGIELWKSDGSRDGTQLIKTLSRAIDHVVASGRTLYFTSDGQLWTSDGTASGTRMLPAHPEGTMIPISDGVVFAVATATETLELWRSDGTDAGTHFVREIWAEIGSNPVDFASVDGRAYFIAADLEHGEEVWVTDGTAEGTELVADLEPGSSGSRPDLFVHTEDHVFFRATTFATGEELWGIPLSLPHLTIADSRIAEGDTGMTTLHFKVTLFSPSPYDVTVEYATSDGSATGGSDYEGVSGLLTFASGETSKDIDVPVLGDVDTEYNETLFVTLSNAVGASLAKPVAFGMIEDDDQLADLALSLGFSGPDIVIEGSNAGPNTATDVRILKTITSTYNFLVAPCLDCEEISPGATIQASRYIHQFDQAYPTFVTATLSARERDPRGMNNTLALTLGSNLVMDALYLTPGSEANLWFSPDQGSQTFNVESSDPLVVSVPASVGVGPGQSAASLVVRGVGVGTATVRVFTPTSTLGTIPIEVVSAGTQPRWPGAVDVTWPGVYPTEFTSPAIFTLRNEATAPFNGERATGVVTFTAHGHELARQILTPDKSEWRVPIYLEEIGPNPIVISYEGDANFLPSTLDRTVYSTPGPPFMDASAQRIGTSAMIRVRCKGSPIAAPTGTITVSTSDAVLSTGNLLHSVGPDVAEATITLPSIPEPRTLTIQYSGDWHYSSTVRYVQITNGRRRTARH